MGAVAPTPTILYIAAPSEVGGPTAALLAEAGTVLHAATCEAALVCAAEKSPDMIIVDLPSTHGMDQEICQRIYEFPVAAKAFLVLLPAEDDRSQEVDFLTRGVRDLVRKPVPNTALLARVSLLYQHLQQELALRESQRLYRLVADMQTELVTRFRPDGTITYANRSYLDFVGKPEDAVVGCSIYDDIPTEIERTRVRTYFETFTSRALVQDNENQLLRCDGEMRDMEWSNFAQFSDAGEITEFQSVGRDITEKKQTEKALRESEARYLAVVEGQRELITRFRPNGQFLFVNQAYCRFVGRYEEEILAGSIFDDVPPKDQGHLKAYLASFTAEMPVKDIENQLTGADGVMRDFEWHDTAYFDADGVVYEFQSVARDVTDRKAAEAALKESQRLLKQQVLELQEREAQLRAATLELERLANTDPLTGAYNRRYFFETGNAELHRAKRYGHPLGFMMLDIDHFKSVNDNYGHDVGDKALQETVEVIHGALRRVDTLGRLGGEEFAILLPEVDVEAVRVAAERIREAVASIVIETEKGPLQFSVSIGVASQTDVHSIEVALAMADKALYTAKHGGRNRVVISSSVSD
ncbi:MAG: diguanylate cyclase [Magnetospiraceae bacterium]